MAPSPSPQRPRTRRSRMSIGHPPSGLDQENITVHGTTVESISRKSTKRGLRSKSLGPGGLEALGEGAGNRQKVQPLPRSILKPSIPLTPPKTIPPRTDQVLKSPSLRTATKSPAKNSTGPPHTGYNQNEAGDGTDAGQKVNLRTEEEQQSAARERERLEIQQRRDERRKSLANRRVSFAPEATLHTWDVVELAEDATSSSEATNSTRRASMGSSSYASPFPNQDERENPGSPSMPADEDVQVAASPANHSESQQKRKRRSSTIIQMKHTTSQDLSSSPTSSIGSDDTHQSFVTGEDDVVDESDTDEDRDLVETEDTITTVDNDDEATGRSVVSVDTGSVSMDSSGELNKSLREATQRAGVHRIEAVVSAAEEEDMILFDEEDKSEDKPIANNAAPPSENKEQSGAAEPGDMTMEVTQSVGTILPAAKSGGRSPTRRESRKSTSPTADNVREDETMDFTKAIGGIRSGTETTTNREDSLVNEDEEMTMDFTAVVGGFIAPASFTKKETGGPSPIDEDEMDLTVARGAILSPVTEHTEYSENGTVGMDFTAAVGAILPGNLQAIDRNQAKMMMEEEVDHGQLTASSSLAAPINELRLQPPSSASQTEESKQPSRTGQQSPSHPRSPASKSPVRQATPLRNASTPTKQLTPKPGRPTTPSKTPPAKNVSMRITSPKRLFKENRGVSPQNKGPGNPKLTSSPLKIATSLTPPVILTPKPLRVSGVGADQNGLGSPRVAALLDRRSSIGDQAAAFTYAGPMASVVRFQDPRKLVEQLEDEKVEQAQRDSRRGYSQTELSSRLADEADNTGSLRDMIGGLTPRKTKLNGRKSLAIGGARGILGKRPRELDEEDEDATPQKLKSKKQSPVKQIHLPAPPSKEETTGRLGKAPTFKISTADGTAKTPSVQSSIKELPASPQKVGKFKDSQSFRIAEDPLVSFNEQLHGNVVDAALDRADEPIHLSDFLNMTSIRFMELTTTKRRHTVAPERFEQGGEDTISGLGSSATSNDDRSLAACVVAGASTIPMLELYQHSCRELKKYILEGRNIVREIEDDTFEDNPPLFREYLDAPASVRAIMDNQFKNVKTHARLLSKAMWYEWRMKLLDGLKEGLVRIEDGLKTDDMILKEKERILNAVMPQLIQENAQLRQEEERWQNQADELANSDPEELRKARDELTTMDEKIAATKKQIAELENQVDEKAENITTLTARRVQCISDIADAEKTREKYRGWSASEVRAERDKVGAIEAFTGWTILSVHEGLIELLYKSEFALSLKPPFFSPSSPSHISNSRITLTYAGENETCSTTQRFFLQLLRASLFSLPQSKTTIQEVLKLVEDGWHLLSKISEQVKDMQAAWPTQEAILNDQSLRITSTVLLRKYRTKVDASFDITIQSDPANINAVVKPHAKTIYGEELKQEKMADVLSGESGPKKTGDAIGGWSSAVETLEKKLNKFLAGKEKH